MIDIARNRFLLSTYSSFSSFPIVQKQVGTTLDSIGVRVMLSVEEIMMSERRAKNFVFK